jgi:hypothetical protein
MIFGIEYLGEFKVEFEMVFGLNQLTIGRFDQEKKDKKSDDTTSLKGQ